MSNAPINCPEPWEKFQFVPVASLYPKLYRLAYNGSVVGEPGVAIKLRSPNGPAYYNYYFISVDGSHSTPSITIEGLSSAIVQAMEERDKIIKLKNEDTMTTVQVIPVKIPSKEDLFSDIIKLRLMLIRASHAVSGPQTRAEIQAMLDSPLLTFSHNGENYGIFHHFAGLYIGNEAGLRLHVIFPKDGEETKMLMYFDKVQEAQNYIVNYHREDVSANVKASFI